MEHRILVKSQTTNKQLKCSITALEEEEVSVVEHGKGTVSKLIWGDQETSQKK